MTKLKEETTRVTTAIKELENELSKYNKGEIQQDINLKSKMNNLLENLMENPEIQPVKRLYRSRKDRVIAGICGGLAKYFNMDLIY